MPACNDSVAPDHIREPLISTPIKFLSGNNRPSPTVYSPRPQPNSKQWDGHSRRMTRSIFLSSQRARYLLLNKDIRTHADNLPYRQTSLTYLYSCVIPQWLPSHACQVRHHIEYHAICCTTSCRQVPVCRPWLLHKNVRFQDHLCAQSG